MDTVLSFLNFVLQFASSFFTFLFSSWLTALLPIGLIVVLVLDLVSSSFTGKDDK